MIIHNSAPVPENYRHKLLWDFDIHTDLLISTRRPDLIIISKIVDFAVPADHRIKLKECKKKGIEKIMEHAGDNNTNCNWCVWNSS